MPPRGRRAQLETDTTPGRILALALIANAPIAIGFVLAPIFTGGDATVGRAFVPAVLYVTPVFALLSIVVFARAGATPRAHRAARIGLVLDVVGLGLWALVLAMVLVS